jgi:S1-C subfamily serine protease
VACTGPFVGEAICHDHEEINVHTIYRDPIHDFGFLQFNPKDIRYMPVTAIPLRPDKARVGLDIRVVGNDAGEKLSILAGSISRLDRNAPEYGEMTYNDFNTFYLQAASSTSGGSSGSPVIDMEGNAVALQAGGRTQAATDFFFPLDRVVYALEHVQKNMQVPRGTIQAQFFYRPFDEVRRLGFSADNEALVRASDATEIGMLVAEVVLPGGPAYGLLEEGDVLVRVNGRILTKFVPLEHWMDTHIGQELEFDVERGGEPMTFRVMVQDLHSITPSRYVKVGGATLNDLSYQLARSYCVPCQGVYVADPAGTFKLDSTDGGWIVESVDDKPTPNLDALIHVAKTIPDQARIPVVYYSIGDVHVKNLAVVTMDKFWSKFRLVTRNDVTGKWDFSDLDKPLPPPLPLQPKTATFVELDDSFAKAKNLIRSLVKVTYYMPIVLDGYPRNSVRISIFH